MPAIVTRAKVDQFADTAPLPAITPVALMSAIRAARATMRKETEVICSAHVTSGERRRATLRVQVAHRTWQRLDRILQEELVRLVRAHREGCRDNDVAAAVAAYEVIADYLEA